MKRLTLWQRLSILFGLLLLLCFGVAAWLQMGLSARYSQQIEQHLLRQLAMHIAAETRAMGPGPLDADRLAEVGMRLRETNPGVELYVLDASGAVQLRYPQTEPLARGSVALAPLHDFLGGRPAPILADDPLSRKARKVFSVARYGGQTSEQGYLYAVLQGNAYDMAAADAGRHGAVHIALWSIGLVAPLGLVAGIACFGLVTRPITRLSREVFELEAKARMRSVGPQLEGPAPAQPTGDEIALLRRAFLNLNQVNTAQWQSLNEQDRMRREWLANISHDLRTPLASIQGYLETLLLNSAGLDTAERDHYLRTALSQSQRLNRLAQELLELARLELGTVKPAIEPFSLSDLVQDILHKLALPASSRQQRLAAQFAPGLPAVAGDIGMIERVITNLLDNAIRHTPGGGQISVQLQTVADRVRVEVIDSGPGPTPELLSRLQRNPQDPPNAGHLSGRDADGGGLGLMIVRQILHLHGSGLTLDSRPGCGAILVFELPVARA